MASLTRWLIGLCGTIAALAAHAEPPGVSYIFPAGGQRGTKVQFRVGGFYFHGRADFHMAGPGVTASHEVKATETIWFEGPPINEPESQKKEDYPKDHLGEVSIDKDAPLGRRRWHCRTSQGAVPSMKFVIGDLAEMIEQEIDGAPIPQTVTLPLTINGRVFPREDVDLWRFRAEKGQTISCQVVSQRLGYPLQPVLEVTGPAPIIPQSQCSQEGDRCLSFTAPMAGEYQIAVHDAGFSGGQNFVYRLTLTSAPRVDSLLSLGGAPAGVATLHGNDLPVFSESTGVIPLPAMLHGRIERPAEEDTWSINLEKGQTVLLDLLAAHLGSKLDSLIVVETDGKELARNDDRIEGDPDSRLLFTAKAAGRHVVKVRDRFASRGGTSFGYRLRITPHEHPSDFELRVAADAFNVIRQTEDEVKPADPAAPKKPAPKVPGLRVDLVPIGAFASDVTLDVTGLPAGVTAEPVKVLTAKQRFAEIRFTAPPRTSLQVSSIGISGTAEVEGKTVTRRAAMPVAFGEPPVDQVRLAIVPTVPFKFVGHYVFTNDQGGGTSATKHYLLERGGYNGPLTASFSDREIRYLRGVWGPPVSIPASANEFDFTVNYPVDIEQGHTSRVQIMVVGDIVDFDGSRHTVSYTSATNDEQVVCSTTAGPLRLSTNRTSFTAVPEGRVEVPVTIQRAPALGAAPLSLAIKIPAHMNGISAAPVQVDAKGDRASFVIEFGPNPGPFNMPVTIVAQTTSAAKMQCIGETKIELVLSDRRQRP